MNKSVIILFVIFSLFSCNEYSKKDVNIIEERYQEKINQKNKEIELKERELELKEKELQILNKQLNDKPKELSEIYKSVKKAVYLVYTKNENSYSQGSAFVISSSGLTISNYHVFENASDAILYNGQEKEFMITEILDYNKEKDYIIFKIGTTSNNLPTLKIANFTPEIGAECFAIGNPKGLTQTLSKGLISSIRDDGKMLQTTAEITNGSSGGPLFNNYGEVIGITTSGLGEANLNFAININELPISIYRDKVNNTETSLIDQSTVKTIITNYYSILIQKKYVELEKLYTPKLKRFFNKFNISRYEAIKNATSYDEKFGVLEKDFNIRWNTLKINTNNNGNSIVEFVMDYSLVRVDSKKPSEFVLYIIMEINSEKKIYSIYENILRQK